MFGAGMTKSALIGIRIGLRSRRHLVSRRPGMVGRSSCPFEESEMLT
jgi:hypothetical protein